MQIVLAAPVLGLIAGAAFGLRWPDVPSSWLAAVVCGWVLLSIHALRVPRQTLLLASACGVFAAGGALLSADAWHRAWRPTLRILFESMAREARAEAIRSGRHPPEDDTAAVLLSGVLRSDGAVTPGGMVALALDVEWAGRVGISNGRTDTAANPAHGGVLLTVLGTLAPERRGEWRAGRRIRASADLRRPVRYLDPGVPDQERMLARRGVTLVGTVKSAALVTVTERGSLLTEGASRVRSFTRHALRDGVGSWSPRAAAIVTAIVIGDRTGLDDEVERRLQESGTYHVIAISGGNIALLAGLLLAGFRAAGLLGRSAMLSAAAGLVAYGFVAGGGASVDRAVLMAAVYFTGRAWDLRGPPLHSLVLVAGLLVLADPLSIADPASLLTFGASAAILAIAPVLPLSSLPRPLRPVAALFAASLSAELALLPVAATLFSRVTFAGLLLNFGAIPLMGVAQLAGMAVVPVYAVWPAGARAVGWLASVGAEGLVRTADLVQFVPWSTWRVAAPGVVPVVAYYLAGLGAWASWRRGRLPPLGLPAPVVSVGLALLAGGAGTWIVASPGVFRAASGDGRLHVTFIDVGQGDAAIVRFPSGAALLIDTGGSIGASSFDIGERVVGAVLRQMGIGRLEILALTHGDADHAGGAPSVLREFRPRDIWDGVPVPPLKLFQQLRADALAGGVRWTTVQRADTSDIGGVTLTVMHPPRPDWERQDVRNDDSIVIDLRWKDVSFVFTGDIGREAEAGVAPLLVPAPLRVLKVAHHGSITSSSEAFLSALAPDVAVISVGRSNTFGHPSPLVLRRFEALATAVFRTDQDGAVSIDTDGTTLRVQTFTGRTLVTGHRGSEHTEARLWQFIR
ncbi:MAG TPA: ComEC/Rec2 family competence protein [Vicinamibacterales bacterium]|nr:ComEC/Rec2 family competence protein [Vicinamibacterales bacterium]